MSLPGRLRGLAGRTLGTIRLEFLRNRLWNARPNSVIEIGGLRMRITDGPNAYMQHKDEFVRRNYAFTTENPSPIVIDGGANMGFFTLATLRDHPGARVTAFEPDPAILAVLTENLANNGAPRVKVVDAALGANDGTMGFTPDGRAGGALTGAGAVTTVRVERLSRHLDAEVDFLKLNIEGAELDVLREAESAGRLRRVRAMVIEYHGWYDGEQRLGALLDLLDRNRFRYLVHDMDEQTNPATKPPFRAPPDGAHWFALVYAWRIGAA
jgi:FkbM family methyltransferase